MPVLRLRHHLAVGELAHLVADRGERLVEPAIADRRLVVPAHQLDQAGPALDVARRHQPFERPRHALGDRRGREPDIGRPHDLALAHRNAALDLREILADPDLDDELLDLAEAAAGVHALRIGRELADRLDIGGEPGKPVGRALLAIEDAADRVGLDADALAHGPHRIRQQPFGHQGGLAGQGDELDAGVAAIGLG